MDDTKLSGRGRKRKTDDSSLPPEEQEKKRKNRDAAKKCREKKEKEAQELKQRNAELENENETLSKEKIKLLEKIKGFKKVIKDHMHKGCKLPPAIEQMLNHAEDSLNDDFREVGVIECYNPRMHTPPHTPDSSSSEKSLQPVSLRQPDAAPTALFSGTPLPNEINKRKNSNSSRSPSRSPGPQNVSAASVETKDLSHHLFFSKNIPPELAPILPHAAKPLGNVAIRSQFPTVVIDDDDDDDDVQEVHQLKVGRTEHVQNQKLQWVPVSDSNSILNKAFEHPDIPSEDVISNQLFEREDNRFRNMNNLATESENLHSLGFNHHVPPLPEGYSYTEDLAEIEAPNNIIYTTDDVLYAEQVVHAQADSQVQSPQENSTANPELTMGAYSPAILSLGPLVSDSLHQQIKKQFSSTAETKQLQPNGQYTITASQMNSVNMVSETSNENYVTAPSNKIFAKQGISKDSQQVSFIRFVNLPATQSLGSPFINSNGQVIYSAKVLSNPLRTNPVPAINTTNPVIEQTSLNLEQDQQFSNSDLPSLNFDDLQQNGNIFDKTKSKK